jgi:hypothetical protein
VGAKISSCGALSFISIWSINGKVKAAVFPLKFVLVEVVRFFVTYGLVRNKNRLCKG